MHEGYKESFASIGGKLAHRLMELSIPISHALQILLQTPHLGVLRSYKEPQPRSSWFCLAVGGRRCGKAGRKVHSLKSDKSEPPDYSSCKTKSRTASFIISKHGRARDKYSYKGQLNTHMERNSERSHKQKPIGYWILPVVIRRAHSGTVDCVVPAYTLLNQTWQRQDEFGRRL